MRYLYCVMNFCMQCIVEMYHRPTESVFNRLLHLSITVHACATQKLLKVCEQVEIPSSQGGWGGGPRQSQQVADMRKWSLLPG
jgi:hypothetical protein